MNKPNFIFIGTQRSASTWIFNCCLEHPEIFVPQIKDTEFFSNYYSYGLDYYKKYFIYSALYKAVGEISPDCLYHKKCAERIHRHFPDIKLIMVLRNPINRAFSAYKKFIADKYKISFDEAIKRFPNLINYGLYYKQIENYLRYFSMNSMFIAIYEKEIVDDNDTYIERLFNFLNVDNTFKPSWVGKKSNISNYIYLRRIVSKYNLHWLIRYLKVIKCDMLINKLYYSFISHQNIHEQISQHTIDHLTEIYSEPINKLEKLLNQKILVWR